jgi:hypothetical protein
MAKKKETPTIEEILDGDMPEVEQDSIVEEATGEFVPPSATSVDRVESPEVTGDKELTDLEKEIEAGKEKVESDILARAAARPTTMAEAIELVPELANMDDLQISNYLHRELTILDVPYNRVGSMESLAVHLAEVRNEIRTK